MMKRTLTLITAALLAFLPAKALPAQQRQIISIETENSSLVFQGDLYRLASPYNGGYYALMYVSEDRSRAVVFTYALAYEARTMGGKTFRLQGLDASKTYKVTEQNVDRSCWWGEGQCFKGDFLMGGGFNPSLGSRYSSAVFLLEAQ